MEFINSTNFIIYDTEYTSWKGCIDMGWDPLKNQYREIVQIGAVKVRTTDLEIIDTYSVFIKPKINPRLSNYFKDLTNISQEDIDNAPSFKEVLQGFLDWIGDLPCYSYGPDHEKIQENIDLYNIDSDLTSHNFNDLREELEKYGIPTKDYSSGTLTKYFGVEPSYEAHNALNDVKVILDALRMLRKQLTATRGA